MLVNSWLQNSPLNMLMFPESSSIWKTPCSINFTFPIILHWLSSLLKCRLDRQSHWPLVTIGYCLVLGDSLISSYNKKKIVITLSSIEAKYHALASNTSPQPSSLVALVPTRSWSWLSNRDLNPLWPLKCC